MAKRQAKQAQITIIIGKRGSGKSTLAKHLLAKGRFSRTIVIDTLGEHGRGRKVVKTPVELVRAVKAKAFNIAVQFDDEKQGFNWACVVAYAARDLALFCDEVDFCITASWAPQPFSKLVRYGRHRDVEMFCVARRPPDLWRNLTANADGIYCFKTHEPRDIKYLSDFIGQDAEQLRTLGQYEYLCYRNGEVSRGRAKL